MRVYEVPSDTDPTITIKNAILMDETAVYLQDPLRNIIDLAEPRHILSKTKGFGSMRITIVLAVQSNGENITPLVIVKSKDSEIEKKYGIWVVPQTQAWVNQCLLK
jgi:hypothetical protein